MVERVDVGDMLANTLVIRKKEDLILDDRTAQIAAELVEP